MIKAKKIAMVNASSQAIIKAQDAFTGAAKTIGINDEYNIQALVDEVRYKKMNQLEYKGVGKRTPTPFCIATTRWLFSFTNFLSQTTPLPP